MRDSMEIIRELEEERSRWLVIHGRLAKELAEAFEKENVELWRFDGSGNLVSKQVRLNGRYEITRHGNKLFSGAAPYEDFGWSGFLTKEEAIMEQYGHKRDAVETAKKQLNDFMNKYGVKENTNER